MTKLRKIISENSSPNNFSVRLILHDLGITSEWHLMKHLICIRRMCYVWCTRWCGWCRVGRHSNAVHRYSHDSIAFFSRIENRKTRNENNTKQADMAFEQELHITRQEVALSWECVFKACITVHGTHHSEMGVGFRGLSHQKNWVSNQRWNNQKQKNWIHWGREEKLLQKRSIYALHRA